MDLTGYYPRLTDADSVYAIKEYSELLAQKLEAGRVMVERFTYNSTIPSPAIPVPPIGTLSSASGSTGDVANPVANGKLQIMVAGTYAIDFGLGTTDGPMSGRSFIEFDARMADGTPTAAPARVAINTSEDSALLSGNGIRLDVGATVEFRAYLTNGQPDAQIKGEIRITRIGAF